MAEKKLPPKVYVRGVIGNTNAISQALSEYGAYNLSDYKFNDPDSIYYIDKHKIIQRCLYNTELYEFISNSEWIEIKPVKSKRLRKYIVTIREGSNSCDGCEYGNKCTEEQRSKCKMAELISSITDGSTISGKTLQIEESNETYEPLTPLTKEDI